MNAVVETTCEMHPPAPVAMNPMQMLAFAIQQGADLDKMRMLLDMKKEWEADEARKAFVAAMADFKADPPEILKTKHVAYRKKDGSVTEYDHASLADVCAAAIPGLAKMGISHRWVVAQAEGRIKVTCVLTHKLGHSESVEMNSGPDDSGGKNGIQAIASAVNYLQRYTLLSATGLAAKDMDDDGQAASGDERSDTAAPAGYDDWNADMTALADEGIPKLQAAWTASAHEFRRFAAKHDAQWWADTKKRAARAAS